MVSFDNARQFIKSKARPLDRAIFEYEFENGSKEKIIAELEAYQNQDGGFGHGLESDFRADVSSALASSVALQTLSLIKAEPETAIVQQVIGYLLHTYNEETIGWEKVPKEVEKAPRAPWWNYQEPRKDWGNPNAEILGYFYEYRELVPDWLLFKLTDYAITHLNNLQEFEFFHEVLCYVRLAERMPDDQYKQIELKLQEAISQVVTTDPAKWSEYSLQPLNVAPSPKSSFYRMFKDTIELNLDYLINQQGENGAWEPNWSWFGQFDQEWESAKVEWQGSLTVTNLLILRAYGAI